MEIMPVYCTASFSAALNSPLAMPSPRHMCQCHQASKTPWHPLRRLPHAALSVIGHLAAASLSLRWSAALGGGACTFHKLLIVLTTLLRNAGDRSHVSRCYPALERACILAGLPSRRQTILQTTCVENVTTQQSLQGTNQVALAEHAHPRVSAGWVQRLRR